MTKKERILSKALEKNGLKERVYKDSLIYNLILDCMQDFSDQQEPKVKPQIVTVESRLNSETKSIEVENHDHVHEWLYAGQNIDVCANCPEFRRR